MVDYMPIFILYISLWFINLIYALMGRENIKICMITYLMLGILFVFNSGVAGDAQIYKEHFENQYVLDFDFEIGYTFLEHFLYSLGVYTYTGWLIFLFFIASFFYWLGLRKMDISYHCLFALVMPFIFPTYATAIRFFIASSIMIVALRYLSERKYGAFIFNVVIAGLFHTLSLLYMFFVFCVTKYRGDTKRKTLIYFIFIFSILLLFLFTVGGANFLSAIIIQLSFVLFFIGDVRFDSYFTTQTNFGWMIFLALYISGLILAKLIYNKINDYNDMGDGRVGRFVLTDSIKSYGELNYNINIFLGVILPLIALNMIFYRLLIIGHISNGIATGILLKMECSEKSGYVITINALTLAFVICCLLWFVPPLVGVQSISIEGMIKAVLNV